MCGERSFQLNFVADGIAILLKSPVFALNTRSEPVDNGNAIPENMETTITVQETPAADGLVEEAPEIVNEVLEVDGSQLMRVIEQLCLFPRKFGTEGRDLAASFITSELNSWGYNVDYQVFPIYEYRPADKLDVDFFEMNPNNHSDVMGYGKNIIAHKLSAIQNVKTLVISAHYDTISNYIGAIDNASGVAAVLEIARMLQNYNLPFNVTYILFDAEERDLTGSRHFVINLSETEKANILGCINLDMVGEKDAGGFAFSTGSSSHNILSYIYNEIIDPNAKLSFMLGSSDHSSFAAGRIPSLSVLQSEPDFSVQRKDDGSIADDLEQIDIDCLIEAVSIGVRFICGIDLDTYSQIMDTLPTVDADLTDWNFEPNDFYIRRGGLNGYSLTRIYTRLLPGGVYSEINYVFSNQNANEYVIRQWPQIVVPLFDTEGFEKREIDGFMFPYYIYSKDGETILYIDKDWGLQTTISGNISGSEAESVFVQIEKR